jgi:hypothetical protein
MFLYYLITNLFAALPPTAMLNAIGIDPTVLRAGIVARAMHVSNPKLIHYRPTTSFCIISYTQE